MISANDLRALRIFRGISPRSLESLAKEMWETSVQKGDTIIREGERSHSLYLIAAGRVSVEKASGDPRGSKSIARLGPEEFFGEMAFLENQPHSATVRALQKTRLFVLSRDSLNRLFKDNAKLALQDALILLSGLSRRLRQTTKELVSVLHMVGLLSFSADRTDLLTKIFETCQNALPPRAGLGYYRWDPTVLGYQLVHTSSHDGIFPAFLPVDADILKPETEDVVEIEDLSKNRGSVIPFAVVKGQLVLVRANWDGRPKGLFAAYSGRPSVFSQGDLQLIEKMASLLVQRNDIHDASKITRIRPNRRRRRERSKR